MNLSKTIKHGYDCNVKKMTLYINLIQGVRLLYCAPIPLVKKKIIVESLLPLPLLADVIHVNGPLTDI